ncbi:MAG: N-acetylmuramoyl-L-alanine amidase [bacterium]|nr:N-acetylmuramoyl-L-alanine amidase [bacterium]
MIRFLTCLFVVIAASAAEIHLVYPRLEAGQDTFRYHRSLDSTFVLGQVAGFQPGMALTCNGYSVDPSQDGAFLAFLQIPWQSETLAWNLSLTYRGAETSTLCFPFGANPEPVPVNWTTLSQPVEFRVKDPAAHTRTMVGGSYNLFPDSGTVLLVTRTSANWLEFKVGGGLSDVIERRFADSVGVMSSFTQQLRIGNGLVSMHDEMIHIEFSADRTSLIECSNEQDGEELLLTVYDAKCAVDRIRYIEGARDAVSDITWSQRPWGVEFKISLNSQLSHGFKWFTSDSTVGIDLYYKADKSSGLRGKRIVLDPGHGGSADGSIGPRGNKEKDIVLHWSEILERELKSKGAEVIRTRTDDVSIGLYDRVVEARAANPDVFLSLHGNALPDGENPFVRHGCGTYYYQTLSRPLAEIIQAAILQKTGLHDDGIFDANFAVVRPTDFPAVLIEAAYIMHPDEEAKLTDEKFLLDLSRGVANGLLDYFSKAPAR